MNRTNWVFGSAPRSLRSGIAVRCSVTLALAAGITPALPAADEGPLFSPIIRNFVPSSISKGSIGDFTGDGVLDFAMLGGTNGSSPYSLHSGNGDGAFTRVDPPITPDFISIPGGVLLADADGDGVADLILGRRLDPSDPIGESHGITVSRSLGGGQFASPVSAASAHSVTRLAAGDLNGDGALDVVALHRAQGSATVFLGDGTGQFQPGAPFQAAAFPINLAIADVNNDGKPDLVVLDRVRTTSPSPGTPGAVQVHIGVGDGTFLAPVSHAVGAQYTESGIAVGDINGDGAPDIATSNAFDSDVSVLINNTHGGFLAESRIPAGTSTWDVEIADIDSDGRNDLIIANFDDSRISVRLGTGSGAFGVEMLFSAQEPEEIFIGRVDNNQSLDLISLSGFAMEFVAMLNQCEVSTPPCADLNADGAVSGIDLLMILNAFGGASPASDLNSDGVVDGADLLILLNAWGTSCG